MRRTRILLSAILAGLCVGFGGLAFLSLDNKVIGAAAFTIGLFVICTFGFHLFTGKVCYVLQNDRDYALDLPVIWLGNLIGTGLTAGTASLTRIAPALREKAVSLCQVKLGDGLLSLFQGKWDWLVLDETGIGFRIVLLILFVLPGLLACFDRLVVGKQK